MSGLISLLPHRDETAITLKESGMILISQIGNDGEECLIKIHADDAPQLIDAIKSAIKAYEVDNEGDINDVLP
ncbi:hypothetical protein GTL21_002379 [Salmonella enterica]|nr:hypothetical protein [Salmonella enterica]